MEYDDDIGGERFAPRHDVDMLRRTTVGSAIRELRKQLQISQRVLADRIGRDTDSGSVSRWERGVTLPETWKRKTLSAMAKAAGRNDLAQCFGDTFAWRWGLRSQFPAQYDLMVLSDMALLNLSVREEDGLPEPEYLALVEAISAATRKLAQLHASGSEIFLWDEDQRNVWLQRIARELAATDNQIGQETR